MRLIYFSISVILVSCSPSHQETPNNKKTNLFKDSVLTIIKGVWIKKDYAESIKRTKSPYKSSHLLSGPVTLVIPGYEETLDSSLIGASLNNHEGESFPIYYRPGVHENSIATGFYDYEDKKDYSEFEYSISKMDTILYLNKYSQQGKLKKKTAFIKVLDAPKEIDAGVDEGLDYYVQQNLFAGRYEVRDTSGIVIANVEMDGWDNIKGFFDYNIYYPTTDFTVAIGNNMDNISFKVSEKDNDWKAFLYSFSGDTLNLYDMLVEGEAEHLKFGKRLYSFVKQKGNKTFAPTSQNFKEPREYFYQNDSISQKLLIEYITASSIKFNLISSSKKVDCRMTMSGEANNKYPNSDPEIDEDQTGIAYPSIEYIYERENAGLIIRISLDDSKVRVIQFPNKPVSELCSSLVSSEVMNRK